MELLDRFINAQHPLYERVRRELADGSKQSHWMWFIFPQIAGLGQSPMSQYYAIKGIEEANDYLHHPVLGRRLAECTDLILGWADRRDAAAILGSIDAMKFKSSMTLFEASGGAPRFAAALDRFFGGVRDDMTLAAISEIQV